MFRLSIKLCSCISCDSQQLLSTRIHWQRLGSLQALKRLWYIRIFFKPHWILYSSFYNIYLFILIFYGYSIFHKKVITCPKGISLDFYLITSNVFCKSFIRFCSWLYFLLNIRKITFYTGSWHFLNFSPLQVIFL